MKPNWSVWDPGNDCLRKYKPWDFISSSQEIIVAAILPNSVFVTLCSRLITNPLSHWSSSEYCGLVNHEDWLTVESGDLHAICSWKIRVIITFIPLTNISTRWITYNGYQWPVSARLCHGFHWPITAVKSWIPVDITPRCCHRYQWPITERWDDVMNISGH